MHSRLYGISHPNMVKQSLKLEGLLELNQRGPVQKNGSESQSNGINSLFDPPLVLAG